MLKEEKKPEKAMKASVDLLGAAPGTVRQKPRSVPHKWAWHYRTLCRLRSELMALRCTLVEDARENTRRPGREAADFATEEFNRELVLAELSHNQDALYEIDAALKRIEEGTYGICEKSGKAIPASRLKALPSARFTCEEERKLEKNGLAPHIRLGEAHSWRELV